MHFFTSELLKSADDNFRAFSSKLIPSTNYEIIGVKTPIIKKLAKASINRTNDIISFLQEKHSFHEELLLHGIFLNFERDVDKLLLQLKDFLPCIDNWAVCDCLSSLVKIFNKFPDKAFNFSKECLRSNNTFTIRFGIVCLLNYFLGKNYSKEVLELVLSIKSDDYYVNIGLAWFYSVALVKKYEDTIWIFENKKLAKFVHNKSIQKAIESFRVPSEIKNYLKTIKIK